VAGGEMRRLQFGFLTLLLSCSALSAQAAFFSMGDGMIGTLEAEVEYRVALPGDEPLRLARESAGWLAQRTVPLNVDKGRVDIWVRVPLPVQVVRRQLLIATTAWEHAEYFFLADGELLRREKTGLLEPWATRQTRITMTPLMLYGGLVTFEAPAGRQVTMLVRLTSEQRYHPVSTLRFSLRDMERVLDGERQDRAVMGIFLGVMLTLVLYNLGLYLVVREASYLHYVVLEAGSAMIWVISFGLASIYLWPMHPSWDFPALWMIGLIAGSAFAQFVRQYLDLKQHFPRLDTFWKWQVIVGLALVPLIFLLPAPTMVSVIILSGVMPVGGLLIIVSVGYAMWKGHPQAPNLLLAVSCIGFGFAALSMVNFGWLPKSHWFSHAAQIGTAAMGIILSIGLGYRLKSLNASLAEKQLAEARLQSEHEREKRELVESQSRELERKVTERTAELASERERAESLLANILPQAVIGELKATGSSEPRRHDEASILFTDFAGFTATVATIPPARLVRELDEIFRAFDDIVARNGLEKIKTIGDAYMAAGGLPVALPDHAARCVRAGLEMVAFIEERNRASAMKWGLRIGVHSGAVIAGIVGKNKYAYDVWGDTVNVASRLESAGEPGRVNVSAYTFECVRGEFAGEYRGKVAAKGKGELDMYFITGPA